MDRCARIANVVEHQKDYLNSVRTQNYAGCFHRRRTGHAPSNFHAEHGPSKAGISGIKMVALKGSIFRLQMRGGIVFYVSSPVTKNSIGKHAIEQAQIHRLDVALVCALGYGESIAQMKRSRRGRSLQFSGFERPFRCLRGI